MYNDVLRTREIHELRLYVDLGTTYNNNAYTITSTYYGGSKTLIVYTIHPILFKDIKQSIEYRIIQLNLFVIIGNLEIFRQEAILLRNARELAKEKREELIVATNDKILDAKHLDLILFTQSFVLLLSNKSVNLESKTSINELALNTNTCAYSTYRMLVEARINSLSKILSNWLSKKKSIRVDKGSSIDYKDLQKI